MAGQLVSASFVVRLRLEPAARRSWWGEVQHVESGERIAFRHGARLLEFLGSHLGRLSREHGEVRKVKRGTGKRSAGWSLLAVVMTVAVGLSAAGLVGAQTVAGILQATLMEPNQRTVEVSTEELLRILADGSATVFDARPFKEFAISHIAGALNVAPKPGVPLALYVSDVSEIGRVLGGNKAAPIVLYCNGPFCGKSKRLAEELLAAGYTNVRRYQLGIPTWRALVGLTAIELEGVLYTYRGDRTAVFVDARGPEEFRAASIHAAVNIPQSQLLPGKDVGVILAAKNDGRLPMEDHNTRIIVFGKDSTQARAVADAIAREAFHNVSYFVGTFQTLASVLK
ncbi:MAG TPA: rhodanese-like domain-containing protein [bacterium]|nr:rhodanese-like domain-containing protein [bacterium]